MFLSALLLTEKASPSNELSLKVPCRPSSTFFADVFIKWRLLLHYKVLLTNQSNLVFVNRLEWHSHAEIQLVYVCLSHECQSPPKCRCRHQNSCCLRPTFFKLCKDRITNDDVDDRVLCTKDQRKGELQFSSFSSLTITNSMHKQFAFWPYLKRNCLFALREKLSDVTSLRPYLFEAFSRLSLSFFGLHGRKMNITWVDVFREFNSSLDEDAA